MAYNWQQKDWPQFTYDLARIEVALYQFAEQQGHLSGLQQALSVGLQEQAVLDMMVAEAVKTFEIEGEYLSREDVLSSIRNIYQPACHSAQYPPGKSASSHAGRRPGRIYRRHER